MTKHEISQVVIDLTKDLKKILKAYAEGRISFKTYSHRLAKGG